MDSQYARCLSLYDDSSCLNGVSPKMNSSCLPLCILSPWDFLEGYFLWCLCVNFVAMLISIFLGDFNILHWRAYVDQVVSKYCTICFRRTLNIYFYTHPYTHTHTHTHTQNVRKCACVSISGFRAVQNCLADIHFILMTQIFKLIQGSQAIINWSPPIS